MHKYKVEIIASLIILQFFSIQIKIYSLEFNKGKDILVLEDTMLFNEANKKSKAITPIQSLTVVSIKGDIKKSYKNNMIYIDADKNKSGWIDVNETTYITENWKIFLAKECAFAIPADSLMTINDYPSNANDRIMRCEIKNMTIDIFITKGQFDDFIKKRIDRSATMKKVDGLNSYFFPYIFNGYNCYYIQSEIEEGRLYSGFKWYDLFINDNTNNFSGIRIEIEKDKNWKNNEVIAHKIIFSFSRSSKFINVPVLNIRENPTTKSKIVSSLYKNEPFFYIEDSHVTDTIGGKSASWIRVQKLDGKSGYIFSGFLEATE